MNLSRVRLSQTFGIIFDFCGIPAALPLSASAVAVRHPWRRRTRYGSGRGCFSRPLQESPRLMLETSLQPQVWTVSTFTLLPLQQPAGVILGHRFGRSCRQRHTHEHTDHSCSAPISIWTSSRSESSFAGRILLPSTCSQARKCDETPRCSNICAAEENATQASVRRYITRLWPLNLPACSAGSADLTAAINRANPDPCVND